MNKVVLVVLDGVGIGALPDAKNFGDDGANTLGNISKKIEDFKLPNFSDFGLGNISEIAGIDITEVPLAYYGKMTQKSAGKDTTSGHWEIAGNIIEKPFPTYPNGFPDEIIEKFKKETGKDVLGNKAASGTEIIIELGKEHLKNRAPIVYTSADSVFQIAAHEEVIPLEELYELCETARRILTGEHGVGRVIARPFKGEYPNFVRTEKRKDFSLKPPENNLLSIIKNSGKEVVGVGKIEDIFAGESLTKSIKTKDNTDGIEKTLEMVNEIDEGLIITNLIDFDMLYGHRNDCSGFFDALYEFDLNLPLFLANLNDDDLLIITSDHGCDPTYPGTDHTREYVPLLVYNHNFKEPKNLGVRDTFADVGQTIAQVLDIDSTEDGESFAYLLE
ncbi:phosphopentomutase [Natranaerofaba carboxydovora]|uniref:phosphopentomutase n=1 Tax=Natranaerofaba carboxydovora TaxID=2742683 RepID=UPI003B84AA1D